ncbi:MAG: DUF5011 domain-containing protein [Bacillus sp. (in: Bacteria)]|nr:DUF5011 domain-containing protein [Bacillus sp. (in: firmicutes)]
MKRKLLFLLLIGILSFSSLAFAETSTLTSTTWSHEGYGTTSVTPTEEGGLSFTYNGDGLHYSPRTWSFTTVAAESKTFEFNWTYNGLHAWYMANAGAEAFADGPNGRTVVTLKPWGGVWDGFGFSGTSQLEIHEGYSYGFVTRGSNYDGTWLLRGSLVVNEVIPVDTTAPVTTASTNNEANQNGWFNEDVPVTLAATDDISGVANTYYSVDGTEAQSGTALIVSGEGNHVVTYWSVDEAGNEEAAKTTAINIDTKAPTLTMVLDKSTLWSPNHKLVAITASTQAADGLSGMESVVLTSIISNEVDFDPSVVDDDVANDIQEAAFGENDTNFLLRSERSGEGTGRIYTITYTATDLAGNQTTATAVVEVPHDKGKKK